MLCYVTMHMDRPNIKQDGLIIQQGAETSWDSGENRN